MQLCLLLDCIQSKPVEPPLRRQCPKFRREAQAMATKHECPDLWDREVHTQTYQELCNIILFLVLSCKLLK